MQPERDLTRNQSRYEAWRFASPLYKLGYALPTIGVFLVLVAYGRAS
jgi:hypothetical protein